MGWRPLEESELVEQAKRGQVNAFEVLVPRYQELAFRTAYLITGDAADAEDAALTVALASGRGGVVTPVTWAKRGCN